MNVVMNWWKLQAEQAPVAWKVARVGMWSSMSFLSLIPIQQSFHILVVGGDDGGSGVETVEQHVLLQAQSTAMSSAPPLRDSRLLLDFRNTEHSNTLLLPSLSS